MELPSVALLVSHAVLGVAGYVTGKVVAERSIAAERGEKPMPHRFTNPLRSQSSRAFVLIIAFLIIIVALATQSWMWQQSVDIQRRESERHDACVNVWGRQMVTAARIRADATFDLDEAARDRDDALDSLLLVAIDNPADDEGNRPPKAQAALDAAIKDYTDAVQTFRATANRVAEVREKHPLPELRCGPHTNSSHVLRNR